MNFLMLELEADVKKSDTEWFANFNRSRHSMAVRKNREGRICIEFVVVPDEDEQDESSAAIVPPPLIVPTEDQFEQDGAIITVPDDDAEVDDWESSGRCIVVQSSPSRPETDDEVMDLFEVINLASEDEEEEEEYEENADAEEEEFDPLALSPDRQAGE
jgi:hypothetical protein